MEEHITQSSGRIVGLDLGDRESHLCVMARDGEIEQRGRVATSQVALRRRFGTTEPSLIVIEAGTHSPWVSRLLEECGHEVLVANPAQLRLISKSDRKTDRLDAERLARVARMDRTLLAPIRHRSARTQADLSVIRARVATVKARTQLVNHVRGSVKAFGSRLPKCSTQTFYKKSAESIPEPLRAALDPVMGLIAELTNTIGEYDRAIESMAKRYPESRLVRQVSGVGGLTAMAYVLTIEDPRRFRNSRRVGAYLGLRPKQRASGDQNPQLGISKAGDRMLRSLLVGSAHYILGPFGPDTDLRRKGLALAERGGGNAKKRAVVAVARKLAVLMHRLWVTGEVYEPLRNASRCEPELAAAR